MIACSEELDSIALASGFGAAGREQSQPQTSSDEERERERVEKDIVGLCKHGAPSCCHKCVGKALSSAARAPAHADISRKKMLRAHSHSDEVDRAANSSNSAADASSAATRAAIDASSLAPLADAAAGAGAGASGSQKKPKCKTMPKPKVALRSKLARTNAKAVASLDAYIRREEKRLDYWNEKCGQCERILR